MLNLLLTLTLTSPFSAKYVFRTASANKPGLGKEAKGGEDAWFAGEELLAVADGVGGWNEQGVDPSKYSRKLMEHMTTFFKLDPVKFSESPKELLIRSAEANKEIGSSTFVLATIDQGKGLLKFANLGDSGFLIMRKNKDGKYDNFFKSEEQQHSFNFPFQVGTGGDNPSKAEELSFPVSKDYLIIMASDGLFDNLYEKDINEIVNKNDPNNLQTIANELVREAFEKSIDQNYFSPFAAHAKKHKRYYKGGKNDDITVVVADFLT